MNRRGSESQGNHFLFHCSSPKRPEGLMIRTGHQQVDEGQGELGEKHDAEGLQLADEQGGDQRPPEAAEAAHHDHDKRIDQDLVRHARVGGQQGPGDHPGKPREGRAESEHAHEDERHIDSQGVHHLAVVHGRPEDDAEPGLVKDQRHHDPDQRAAGEDEDAVDRVDDAEDVHRAPQKSPDVDGERVVAPDPLHQFGDDVGQAEGQEELVQVPVGVDPAQEKALDERADDEKQ